MVVANPVPEVIMVIERKPLIILLSKRLSILLFVLMWITFFVYLLGSIQEFQESTQLALLYTSSILSSALFVFTLLAISLNIGFAAILRKPLLLLGGLGYMLIAINALAIIIISGIIIIIAKGNG